MSGSINAGSIAKHDKGWYGEYHPPACASGSICQYFCPAAASLSVNLFASSEKHPVPYFPGRENTGNNTPLALIINYCTTSHDMMEQDIIFQRELSGYKRLYKEEGIDGLLQSI